MHVITFHNDAGEKIGYSAIKNHPTKKIVQSMLIEEGKKAAYAVFFFFGSKRVVIINPLRKRDVVDSLKPSFLEGFCYI